MLLADSLILVVGPAIAKTVLKLWAGDEKLASETGGAAIEALGKLIPEIRTRNEANPPRSAASRLVGEGRTTRVYGAKESDRPQEKSPHDRAQRAPSAIHF